MNAPVYAQLAPVRRWQQRLRLLKMSLLGALAGALGALAFGLMRWLVAWPASPWPALAIFLAGILAGILWARRRPTSWREAALAVDRHYGLKDRTVTALEFVAQPVPNAMHELQVLDAVRNLNSIEARAVEPFRLPRIAHATAAMTLVALAVLLWPISTPTSEAAPSEPLAVVLEQADKLKGHLQELGEIARDEQDPELAKLVEQLRGKVEEMKKPGVDVRDALAKLSEMQAAIAAHQAQQQAEHNVALVDEQLKSLGEAMSPAAALQGAGKALQQGDYEKAAAALDELKEPPADRQEAAAVEKNLKQVAGQMRDKKLERLSAATAMMAEGMRGDRNKFESGSKQLSKQVKQHENRRRMNKLLALQQERLKECKSECQNPNPYQNQSQQAKKPSSNRGEGPGGNPFGEPTKTGVGTNLKETPGTPGAGPSEFETERSPLTGAQPNTGAFSEEVYQRYRRMSEVVLETEEIPLGQRRLIRRYFELIRPEPEK